MIVATPDTPLITMGSLEKLQASLSGAEGVGNLDEVYAWVMNNFRETNFKVSLGGFGQYRYSLLSTEETDPQDVCVRLSSAIQNNQNKMNWGCKKLTCGSLQPLNFMQFYGNFKP